MRRRGTRHVFLAAALLCVVPNVSLGYSVLAHEAVIDTTWDSDIVPILRKRFPSATLEDIRRAHAYAYGGAIIQDLGYYPFGSKFYSDLTHYVRSGEFVQTLLADAKNIEELAFAIGALSHYSADNAGHSLATNSAVPLLYPKLRQRFGDHITYAQKKSAHLQTEFGFDVLQVARGHYAPQAYHDFIGFKVARDLLARAFRATYGLELKRLFIDMDVAFGSYRWAVSDVIPRMTRVAWHTHKKRIAGVDSAPVPGVFEYKVSQTDFEKEWGAKYRKPGPFSKALSFVLQIVPKIGPLKGYAMRPPTAETEKLFVAGYEHIIDSYRQALTSYGADTLTIVNVNMDVGRPTPRGEYTLTDRSYARLLRELAKARFAGVDPGLRTDILAFYADTISLSQDPKLRNEWKRISSQLHGLRNATLVAR